MRPEGLIDKPGGRPVAWKVSEAPAESVAVICRPTAVPRRSKPTTSSETPATGK